MNKLIQIRVKERERGVEGEKISSKFMRNVLKFPGFNRKK